MVGKLFELGAETPFRQPEVWSREPTSGPERLRIGAGDHPVDILTTLAAHLSEPLYVMAVLSAPRVGDKAKLESHPLSRHEAADFLREFRDLFENDARAQAWVGACNGNGLLVLDEHDLIYAYGPLDDLEHALTARGYRPGDPHAPDPHEHKYNEELDPLEARLRERWEWRQTLPLDTEDD